VKDSDYGDRARVPRQLFPLQPGHELRQFAAYCQTLPILAQQGGLVTQKGCIRGRTWFRRLQEGS